LPAVLLPKSLDLMIWAQKFERATDGIERLGKWRRSS
jgi:hypothetical protein